MGGSEIEVASLKARVERLEVLYQVSQVIHSTLEPQAALQLIVSEAVRLVKASSGSVVLLNPSSRLLEIQAASGLPPESFSVRLKLGEGITGMVARTGKALRIGDVRSEPRYVELNSTVRSELAVPLEVNGEVRGVINVDSERIDAFSAEDEELLRDLARQGARVIENTWRFEQSRLKAKLFESLISVSQAVNNSQGLHQILRVVTREACVLMGGRMCSLLLLDESGEWLELAASHGAGEAYRNKPRLAVSDSFVGVVVRRRKPLQLENVQTSGRYQNAALAWREGLVSLLSVPLMYARKTLGALNLYTGELHNFSNEEIRILSALAELSAVAIEKARLHEQTVDLEERLLQNEKLSAIGLLAAEVAHEIRNPLTVIKMLYHSLNLGFPPEDPRARDTEVIRERLDHLNKIVEQILLFARNAEPSFAEVDLNGLLLDLVLLIRHKLSNQRIELVQELQPDLPRIKGDATQLGQAFLNLALNAIEVMPDGGRLRVGTRFVKGTETSESTVETFFADSGPGMAEEQQKQAFKSLLQTTKKSGTGLGLAIVGKIVDTHGGRVWIESKAGAGTTFFISLPA